MAEQTRTKRRKGSWRRVPEQRRLGGVAAGVSARTGIDVTVVRTVFVFLALAGGFGIANEKKWGYFLAVGTAVLQVAVVIGRGSSLGNLSVLIELGFDVALVVLLTHPMSRSYQRIWFK